MNRIAKLRRARGLSQKELAQAIYVDAATLSRWERGYRVPDVDTALRMAEVLGCSLDDLFSKGGVKKWR